MEREWEKPARIVRVLVGADDRAMQKGLTRLLAQLERMELVGVAEDGMEAVQMAVQLRPDVAILAVDLPVMNVRVISE